MAELRPRLRSDVRLERDEEGPLLVDPLTGLQLQLDATAARIVRSLDGDHSLEEIAAGPPPIALSAVGDAVRRLLLLNLLEGAGAAIVARLRAVRSGAEPLGFAVLREDRFACQGSGGCCEGYEFGPLEEEDVATIEGLDIAGALPHLAGHRVFRTDTRPDGGRDVFLATSGERCVFLLEDRRCGLHAAFGPDAKPVFCRLYPYAVLMTIAGIKVSSNGECVRLATSACAGPPVVDRLPGIERLIAGYAKLAHPAIFLDAETPLDFGHFLRLQKEWVARIASRGADACAGLVAAGRLGLAFVEALRRCPLEPGQPDACVTAVLASEPPASGDARAGCEAVAGLCAELADDLTLAIGKDLAERHGLTERAYLEVMPLLHLLQTIATTRARPELTLSDYFREVAAVDRNPAFEALRRTTFRQSLFAYYGMVRLRPLAAVLRVAVCALLGDWGARLYALAAGRARLAAEDFSRAHALARRVLRRPYLHRYFIAGEEQLADVLAALPGLLASGHPPDAAADHRADAGEHQDQGNPRA